MRIAMVFMDVHVFQSNLMDVDYVRLCYLSDPLQKEGHVYYDLTGNCGHKNIYHSMISFESVYTYIRTTNYLSFWDIF